MTSSRYLGGGEAPLITNYKSSESFSLFSLKLGSLTESCYVSVEAPASKLIFCHVRHRALILVSVHFIYVYDNLVDYFYELNLIMLT